MYSSWLRSHRRSEGFLRSLLDAHAVTMVGTVRHTQESFLPVLIRAVVRLLAFHDNTVFPGVERRWLRPERAR